MKLLIAGIPESNNLQKTLKTLYSEIIYIKNEKDALKTDTKDIHTVICNNLFLYHEISDFKSLRIIHLTSAGLDKVPLSYIKKNNIKLYNAEDTYSIPISEWIILKILEIYKNSRFFYNNQIKKIWEKDRQLSELTDKTASIIGCGNIGIETAKRLSAFGTEIIGIDIKYKKSPYINKFYKDINKGLESDIIILSLPLTKETDKIINQEKIEKMKDNAVLINVSRGSIIHEEALIKALRSNKFKGIALDVFQEEPLPKDSPLWDFDNIIITPHNSFISDMIIPRLNQIILKNLRKSL